MKKLLSILLSLSLVFGLGIEGAEYAEATNTDSPSSYVSAQESNNLQVLTNLRLAKKSKSTSTKSKSTKKSSSKTKKSTKSKTTTKKSKTTKTKSNTKSNSNVNSSSTKQEQIFSVEYTADTTQGKIKGNKNSMIYHVPGGASYDKISVNNVVYFDTEQDAIDAGYRKAKR